MFGILKIDIGNNRVYGLDIIRCLAIFFVVFGHGNLFISDSTARYLEYFVFDGVSIFFVLSGYLIGSILIKEIETKPFTTDVLINFWKRRWYRTLPNYFLVLSVLIILSYFFTSNFNLSDSLAYYIFCQNLYYPHPNWFPEAWSLSIEEWFYIIIPVVLFCLIRFLDLKTKRSVLLTAILVIFSVTIFRYFRSMEMVLLTGGQRDLYFRKQVFTRIDSIMFGVLGAYIAYFYKSFWIHYRKILFAIGVVLLISNRFFIKGELNSFYTTNFAFTLNSIGTLLILPLLSQIKSGKGFVYKVVTYISLISYSMYLINLTLVKNWIISNMGIDFINSYFTLIINYFLYWIFTIVISIFLYKYFEVPTTKLRDNKKSDQ
ncbi:acyltransferase family protein [Flavobacterium piscisymbiosum]|uniref:Acyltransferase n=1 Tax=Flavobacterium piscisymbiosum TaxID=2893753 RepID=A0ABS8MLM5_9FLAO|nr:acyltransferase [Flavobacterium sp. F-30]MCC9066273.1 acyltransferase [Flavobacterium sp. F-30]